MLAAGCWLPFAASPHFPDALEPTEACDNYKPLPPLSDDHKLSWLPECKTAALAATGRQMEDGAGQLADGTRYERSTTEEYGPDGYWLRTTIMRGVSAQGQVCDRLTLNLKTHKASFRVWFGRSVPAPASGMSLAKGHQVEHVVFSRWQSSGVPLLGHVCRVFVSAWRCLPGGMGGLHTVYINAFINY